VINYDLSLCCLAMTELWYQVRTFERSQRVLIQIGKCRTIYATRVSRGKIFNTLKHGASRRKQTSQSVRRETTVLRVF
jgi:hypothetical protein